MVVEAAALLVALAVAGGPVPLPLSLPVALVLTLLAVGRWGGRPVYRWLVDALRFAGRTRTLPTGANPATLLDVVAGARVLAGEVDSAPTGVVADVDGLAAVLELTGPDTALCEAPAPLPPLSALLPAATPGSPRVRVQLLVWAAAPVDGGLAGSSYRQLAEGRIAARQRTVLAVRACRDDRWTTDDLSRALSGAVRRIRRRLAADRVSARPLDPAATLALIGELACHDATEPVRENWAGLRAGGRYQACLSTRRLPVGELTGQAITRALTVPGSVVALSVTAGRDLDGVRADLAVRLAAPKPGTLAAAVSTLIDTLTAVGCAPFVPDGAHLPGCAATLPLGRLRADAPRTDLAVLDAIRVPVGAGLMLGVNRRQEPVAVDVFRAAPTTVLLLGGLALAQALVIRALALDVRVAVRTGRPDAWEPLRRRLDPAETFAVHPLHASPPDPASALRPSLVVIDGAPGVPVEPIAWQTVLLLRERVSTGDETSLVRADLVLAQPLPADQATLVGTALGLGSARQWLSRARPDLLALISRRAVRWVRLATTPVERQLVGPLEREDPW
ncbi:MAG TPA: type VII secretion protein EccE [Micromonosporaceae bacterium]